MTVVNIPIAADGHDGYGWRADSVWASIAAGTYTDSPGETVLTPNKALYDKYYAQVAYLLFDTSGIPAGSTINSAKLQLNFISKSITNAGYKMVGQYSSFDGEPSVAADWVLTASGIFTAVDPTAITPPVITDIPLTSLVGINPGGNTAIALTMDAGGATPTGGNYLQFASKDNTTYQEPRLEVDYTAPAGGSGTAKSRTTLGAG